MDPYTTLRMEMVTRQIENRGVHDLKVLNAMRTIPRHLFLPQDLWNAAYEDRPLPIGFNQTISQPYIVALMTELLCLHGNERVLEIGSGTGYQAAILSLLCLEVHTVERNPELALLASTNLKSQDVENVSVHCADGCEGWAEAAPFRSILVTAAAPAPPPALLSQLEDGGRMVIPIGGRGGQDLQLWWKDQGTLEHESILPVVFVPLRGSAGWSESDWP